MTLFEQLGGKEAVQKAVVLFYEKVMADKRINSFFAGIDMAQQRKKQTLFLTYVFGGPNNYSGKNMREAHAVLVKKGLSDVHFDAVIENLGNTLVEMGVGTDLINQAAAIAQSTRNDVLGR